jgi:hypothetical protein
VTFLILAHVRVTDGLALQAGSAAPRIGVNTNQEGKKMTRNFKILGLALVAVFAFGAMAAAAASAQNGRLTSTGPVTLDATEIAGKQTALTTFGGKLECPGSVMTGHKYNVTPHTFIPSGAETITLTPAYTIDECFAESPIGSGKHFVTITMNQCDYVLHLGTTTGVADQYNVTADVVCPENKSIIVDVYFSATSTNEGLKICETTIGQQAGLAGPTATDTTTGDLTVNGTFKRIRESRSGAGCATATTEEGEFHINLTVKGTNEAGGTTSISLSHA